jgi:Domain of unknown function (DUF4159)
LRKAVTLLLLLCCLSAVIPPAHSQRRPTRDDFRRPLKFRGELDGRAEFTFARLRYDGYGWEGWATDYPKADHQFIYGLRSWVNSRLEISDNPKVVAMDEKELFQHPFIYVVEPGHMELSAKDAANLREYLMRGGFLMLDDFHGEFEWQVVREQMYKIFPDRQIRDLPLDHPVFHCYFDINEVVQVPQAPRYVRFGITYEKGGIVPHYMGITDDNDRLMVFIARNMDNGDAWEWIEIPEYPLKYGLAAYRLGMNCIVYAMTH